MIGRASQNVVDGRCQEGSVTAEASTQSNRTAGIKPLLVVSLRQDRLLIAPWIALITVLSASSILAYLWVFPDQADRMALANAMGSNPALSLVFGPAHNMLTSDGFNAWRAGQLGAFFSGLMTIFIVVRNTRAAEDSGQAELLASGVMGRGARLAVAVFMAAIASLALGVVCFVVTVLCGGGVIPTLLLSASYTASGLMFAGVAALASQLSGDARGATSLSIATLGIIYVLRGYADTGDLGNWASWATPLGWLGEIRPGTANNPWPLLLALGFAILLISVAFLLQAKRDFGFGMLPQRPGRPRAGLARTIWGHSLKLHLPSIVAWLVAFVGLSALFGTLVTTIDKIMANSPGIPFLQGGEGDLAATMSFGFLGMILKILAIIAAVMGVQVIMKIHSEEASERAEPLLAGSLSRQKYLASHAIIAFAGTALALLVGGLFLGIVAHASEPTIDTWQVLHQALVTIPGASVLVGLALLAVGAVPSRRLVGWLGIVATFALTILGPTFNLWNWALAISPLYHLPNVGVADPDFVGVTVLLLITIVFTTVGFLGYCRRDMNI